MWRMKTTEEQYYDSVFYNGHFLVHPNGRNRTTHNKWIYLPDDKPDIFKGVKLLPDKKPDDNPFK